MPSIHSLGTPLCKGHSHVEIPRLTPSTFSLFHRTNLARRCCRAREGWLSRFGRFVRRSRSLSGYFIVIHNGGEGWFLMLGWWFSSWTVTLRHNSSVQQLHYKDYISKVMRQTTNKRGFITSNMKQKNEYVLRWRYFWIKRSERRARRRGELASRRNKKERDFTQPFIHKSTLLSTF